MWTICLYSVFMMTSFNLLDQTRSMEYETYDTDATYDEMNDDEGVKGKV